MIKTPRGTQRHRNHRFVSSRSRLFCPESSDNGEFRTGANEWVTRKRTHCGAGGCKGDLWFPWGPPEGGASFIAASCSAKCSSAQWVSSHLGQQEELSFMVEDVTRWLCASTCAAWGGEIFEVFVFTGTNQLQEAFGSNGCEAFKTDGNRPGLWRTTEICESHMVDCGFWYPKVADGAGLHTHKYQD